jgi:hypothetical protein
MNVVIKEVAKKLRNPHALSPLPKPSLEELRETYLAALLQKRLRQAATKAGDKLLNGNGVFRRVGSLGTSKPAIKDVYDEYRKRDIFLEKMGSFGIKVSTRPDGVFLSGILDEKGVTLDNGRTRQLLKELNHYLGNSYDGVYTMKELNERVSVAKRAIFIRNRFLLADIYKGLGSPRVHPKGCRCSACLPMPDLDKVMSTGPIVRDFPIVPAPVVPARHAIHQATGSPLPAEIQAPKQKESTAIMAREIITDRSEPVAPQPYRVAPNQTPFSCFPMREQMGLIVAYSVLAFVVIMGFGLASLMCNLRIKKISSPMSLGNLGTMRRKVPGEPAVKALPI